MPINIKTPAGGGVILAATSTASDVTLTMPAETGTVYSTATPIRTQKGVPAFSVYQSVPQSFPNAVLTKIQYNAETYDVTGAFDSTTNYRFQPTTAGYYFFSSGVYFNTSGTANFSGIYKNGTEIARSAYIGAATFGMIVSTSVYLNGSTDYIEFFATQNGGVQNSNASLGVTYATGILVAAA